MHLDQQFPYLKHIRLRYTLTKIGAKDWFTMCAQKYVPDGDGGKGKIVIQQGVVKVQNYIFAEGSAENVLELKSGTSLYTVSQSKNSVCPFRNASSAASKAFQGL